jgi:hypothetical protein
VSAQVNHYWLIKTFNTFKPSPQLSCPRGIILGYKGYIRLKKTNYFAAMGVFNQFLGHVIGNRYLKEDYLFIFLV